MPTNFNSQWDILISDFERVEAEFEALYRDVGQTGALTRPGPQSWSVAECLSHLQETSDAYVRVWNTAIADARRRDLSCRRAPRLSLLSRLMIWSLEPPPLFRIASPPRFAPVRRNEMSSDGLAGFTKSQRQVRMLIKGAEGLALDRVTIVSPFNARLRYTVWASFHIVAAHQRRHLWQAQRAAKAIIMMPGTQAWSAR